jgi:hypothetical protein
VHARDRIVVRVGNVEVVRRLFERFDGMLEEVRYEPLELAGGLIVLIRPYPDMDAALAAIGR